MEVLLTVNFILGLVFTLCYGYQLFYILVALFHKPKEFPDVPQTNRFAVIISARNEENVIGNLLDTIAAQTYPRELIDVFVVADNCADNTAQVCENKGAMVYRRDDMKKVGKGYAIDFLMEKIFDRFGKEYYDGYFVFDADNLLENNYIAEMNKVFVAGYPIITSYRNSKNYSKNWISAGYALWFLREAKYLNNARMILGTSCAISGTGFLISKEIVKRDGGWKCYLLTEDIEFTTKSVVAGDKIGYCDSARLYDEQPEKFSQSWRQRTRWSKGYYQVYGKYGWQMLRGIFKGPLKFSCFDMTMTIMPAIVVTFLITIFNLVWLIGMLVTDLPEISLMFECVRNILVYTYTLLFAIGAVTVFTERKSIHCKLWKRILYIFTFPLFMFTYLPIAIWSIFAPAQWKPIKHSVCVSVEDIKKQE